MLSSHTVGFQWPDNSNLANLTPGLCNSSWSCYIPHHVYIIMNPSFFICIGLCFINYYISVSLSFSRRTLLGYYVEGMHANC